MLKRSLYLLLALFALGVAVILLLKHPLGIGVSFGFSLVALLVYFRPNLLLFLIPAILPILGFAPWSGWITFEELDLMVLASAVAGYTRFAFQTESVSRYRISRLVIPLLVLMALSVCLSLLRGFSDAGGFTFGWFQGYDGPMNSVRVGKSFFLGLLLLPLLLDIRKKSESDGEFWLGGGMVFGLGLISLAALWERLAFTDLLNFSSDYRTTALFWEMHVGGAALDGWILLTFPFAIWAIKKARTPLHLGISFGLLLLAAYASLTTFSRGVYLALPISLTLLAWQLQLKSRSGGVRSATDWGAGKWVGAALFISLTSLLIFSTGGYRGLLALIGLIVILLSMPFAIYPASFSTVMSGASIGLISGLFFIVLANYLPKGPYILYLALFFFNVFLLYFYKEKKFIISPLLSVAVLVSLMASATNVAHHWGGIGASLTMTIVLLMLFMVVAWSGGRKRTLWPEDIRWRGKFLAMCILAAATVSIFAGGSYMGGRFAASGQDFEGRLSHWQHGLLMIDSPSDIVFGKGLGRFPANYYFAAPNSEFPGTYRVIEKDGNSVISLVGSRHPISFGNILRLSQRLSLDAHAPFVVRFKIKAKTPVKMHFEVCEKHLLYSAPCAIGIMEVKPSGIFESKELRLGGASLQGGPWYAPRIKSFAFGIANGGGAAELDDISLISGDGFDLLRNGDFSSEMKNWFFTSERDHLPWHAKNMLLAIFVDQGVFGVGLFVLLTVYAFWSLGYGKAKDSELAPYLMSGLAGFWVVGLFDSLIDVPRLSFIYYFLVFYSLTYLVVVKKRSVK